MSTITIPFAPWCIDYHKTMAAAIAAGNAIRKSASIFELAKDFWSVDRKFRALLKDLNASQTIPCEEIARLAERLDELYSAVDKVLDLAGKRGLTNRSLINGSIQSLKSSNIQLLDFIERLRLADDRAVIDEALEAIAEREKGETVSLRSLL
jgi:ribosomal protein L17